MKSFGMKRRIKRSLFAWVILSPLIATILFPFVVMLRTALSPRTEIFISPSPWWPKRMVWGNFVDMWNATGFGLALSNSLYLCLFSTLITLIVAIPSAYALSRYRFRGKRVYRQFLLITQMLSPIVLVLGLFHIAVWVGLDESLRSLVIFYAAFNTAFAVWMLQSYFSTIPQEIEEAAWIDGANRIRTLISIFLPLATPAIAVTAILTFISAWNEFVLALTMLRDTQDYTLPIRIFSLVAGRYTVEWHHVMAATLLATVPVALVFSWLQRYLVHGLALGAER